jgi:hypothetical protein
LTFLDLHLDLEEDVPAPEQKLNMNHATGNAEGGTSMLNAIKFIKAIDADSKPVLLRASDSRAYVTKWMFKERENRRLINEWIAAPVLRYMGAICPETAIIEVSEQFIKQNRAVLQAAFGKAFVNIKAGPVFASHFDEHAELVNNQPLLEHVVNITDFHAALVADVFLCQGDKRQAIFERVGRRQYRARLIDNANALESVWWQFKTEPNAVFADRAVYQTLTPIALEQYIEKLEAMPRSIIANSINQLPQCWIGSDRGQLEHVFKTLLQRQRNLRFLMHRWIRGENSNYLPQQLVREFSLKHPCLTI